MQSNVYREAETNARASEPGWKSWQGDQQCGARLRRVRYRTVTGAQHGSPGLAVRENPAG